MSNKCSQKLVDSTKISTADTKTVSKRAIKKTAEATGDIIGNKIADKISDSNKLHQKSLNELCCKEIHSTAEANNEMPKEKYISPGKRQQIIDEVRFV